MRIVTIEDVLAALEKAPVTNGRIMLRDLSTSPSDVKYISGYSVFTGTNAVGGYHRVVSHDRVSHAMFYITLNDRDELCIKGDTAPVLCSVDNAIGLLPSLQKLHCLSNIVIL